MNPTDTPTIDSLKFHANVTYGPTKGAIVVVSADTAAGLERRLRRIISELDSIQADWLSAQSDGLQAVFASIRRQADLSGVNWLTPS